MRRKQEYMRANDSERGETGEWEREIRLPARTHVFRDVVCNYLIACVAPGLAKGGKKTERERERKKHKTTKADRR